MAFWIGVGSVMPRSARTLTSWAGTPSAAKVAWAAGVALVGAAEEAEDKGDHSRVVCLTTLVPPAAELEKRCLTEEGRDPGDEGRTCAEARGKT